jgi:hypothetical protein
MNASFLTLEQMDAVYKVEQDWLFERLLEKLNSHRHLILAAGLGRTGICERAGISTGRAASGYSYLLYGYKASTFLEFISGTLYGNPFP